ncbi:MAG TPA: hypothetical protein VF175_14130 [Lacipirellula sp.]
MAGYGVYDTYANFTNDPPNDLFGGNRRARVRPAGASPYAPSTSTVPPVTYDPRSAPPSMPHGTPGNGYGYDSGSGARPQGSPQPQPMTAPQPPRATNYNYLSAGYSRDKLADTSHDTAKYQLGRVFSQFDPSFGVTPQVLAALNALGLATFSGSGDKLGLSDVTRAGQAAGLNAHDFVGDFIRGFHSDHPLWGYDAIERPVGTPRPAAAPSATPPSATPTLDLNALLQVLSRPSQPVAPPPNADALGSYLRMVAQSQADRPQAPTVNGVLMNGAQPVTRNPAPPMDATTFQQIARDPALLQFWLQFMGGQ